MPGINGPTGSASKSFPDLMQLKARMSELQLKAQSTGAGQDAAQAELRSFAKENKSALGAMGELMMREASTGQKLMNWAKGVIGQIR